MAQCVQGTGYLVKMRKKIHDRRYSPLLRLSAAKAHHTLIVPGPPPPPRLLSLCFPLLRPSEYLIASERPVRHGELLHRERLRPSPLRVSDRDVLHLAGVPHHEHERQLPEVSSPAKGLLAGGAIEDEVASSRFAERRLISDCLWVRM